MERERPSYPVQSLERAIRLLEVLREADRPMAIVELSARLDLGASAVHRYLDTLVYHGLVEQDPETLKYSLGVRFVEFGASVIRRLGFGERVRPYLERLAAEVGETVNLSIPDGGSALFIDKIESQEFLRTATHVGARVPLNCTGMGKAMLAYLPEAELAAGLEAYSPVAYTPNTITDRTTLRAHLALIRRQGYAVDDEEYIAGVRCVGAPIFSPGGRVVAALSVSGPASRLTPERIRDVAPRVKEIAQEISARMGMELALWQRVPA